MTENNKYRTPTVEEFVQGFEFEYYDNTSHRMVMLDFSNGTSKDLTERKYVGWVKRKVDWKNSPGEKLVGEYYQDDGSKAYLHFSGAIANFFNRSPYDDMQKLIDDGRIRCEC